MLRCTNGLVVSAGDFPVWRVAHRGDVVGQAVQGALEISGRFGNLGASVERMEHTLLREVQRLDFAADALALRFPDASQAGVRPAQLLEPRRPEDAGRDLWRTWCRKAIGIGSPYPDPADSRYSARSQAQRQTLGPRDRAGGVRAV
jgi:hypothetical protein